jgi:TolB-like protein/class 3 adenylate cyclase/tetratricopeptide (TPR) repeat protein
MEAHHAQAAATRRSACFDVSAVSETRKLAAILVSDIVGYSRLAGADEDRILARLRTLRSDLIDPTIAVQHGRIIKRTGDGSIIEFRSVVDAVNCAIEVQRAMVERNAGVPEDKRIQFRIGIHLGDVVEESDGDLMGDGVNIASRLQSVALPGAICLSEQAYWQVRGRLDLKVNDLGATQLKNIAELVHIYSLEVGQPAQAKAPSPEPTPEKFGPPRLSLVVLPFANIGGDPEQEYFADGVTESLTTDLSRISGAFVIGRSTAFSYKGKSPDLKQVGRELNVRYVLEGSVQRAANRLRVNVQLIEAETGSHLWAERFDKPVADLFDMQDEIVSRLANRLGQELARAEARRAARVATPDSMDHFFLGLAAFNKGPTAEHLEKARAHFDRALDLDPENVDALVSRAWVNVMFVANHLSDDRAKHLRSAEADLTKALKLRPGHAIAHCALGVLRMYGNRALQGIAECERALAIDPNYAHAHGWIGAAKYLAGRNEETEAHILEALRISPRDTRVFVWALIAGVAKLHSGRDEEAVAWLTRSIELNPSAAVQRFWLAAALARLGRPEEACEQARAGLELNPDFTIARLRSSAFSDHPVYLAGRERVYEGLRMAGVPEG